MSVRHFLRDDDLTAAEQKAVLARAAARKADRFGAQPLAGPQVVALIFDKPTLRTQLSFSVGVVELGGYPMIVDGSLAQIGDREAISDVAHVLERQVAAIVWRTYGQERLEEMAANSRVPVINALTDTFHPCQTLADLMTISEQLTGPGTSRAAGELNGLAVAYVGDGANNMAHSYLLGCALAGIDLRIATPGSHQPRPEILAQARTLAQQHSGAITITSDATAAVRDAEVVITDTWVSMGMEAQASDRKGLDSPFVPYSLTATLLSQAAPQAIVLHCLPAYRGIEIDAAVIDGAQSVVFDEAENRLHAQKAVLEFLLEQSGDVRKT